MDLLTLERKLKNLVKKELDKKTALTINEKLRVFLNFEKEYGDYSSNLIFLLRKFIPQKEKEIIEKIKREFKNYFQKIEIINEHINFYLADYILIKDLQNGFKNLEKFLKQNYGRNRKVNLDYVSANPTGPLTLGNARGAVVGDVLANILKLIGFRVSKEYYVNDRGRQIEILGKTILAHLGQINFEDEFYQGEYLKEIAKKFNNKIKNEAPEKIGKKVADDILENLIKPSLKKFGTNHDFFFYETELYQKNLDKKILKILETKGLLARENEALILKLTKLGEPKDEVLIKKNGDPTYFFSDLIHYYFKYFIKKIKIDILIVASDHFDHTRRLKSALKIFKIKNFQFQPLVYQMIHLKRGEEFLKISKRKGIFITLQDLIEEIDPGILRFFFLQKSPDVVINFDLDLAKKESEENPYWYVMYAYARLNSVLKKAKEKNLKIPKNLNYLKTAAELIKIPEIKEILRLVHKFKDLAIIVYQEKRANLLIEYLINFARLLHSFYEQEKILPDLRKLAFVSFLKKYLTFLWKLLEIKPVEKI